MRVRGTNEGGDGYGKGVSREEYGCSGLWGRMRVRVVVRDWFGVLGMMFCLDVIGVGIFNGLGGQCKKESVLHVNWHCGSQCFAVPKIKLY